MIDFNLRQEYDQSARKTMKISTVLQQLGYSAAEAKIYVGSLKMGEATVSDIANETQIPRSTVKDLLAEMHKNGTMNYYPKRGRKLWFAESPDKILSIYEEKQQAFKEIIPQLKSIGGNGHDIPKIRIFAGPNEIKMILDDIIATKNNMIGVVDWDDWNGVFGEDYVADFMKRRIEHGLKIRVIMPRTDNALKLKPKNQQELRQLRFSPADFHFRTTNFSYGNKVAIISLNKKKQVGLLIEDEDIANTMRLFFEGLWNTSID